MTDRADGGPTRKSGRRGAIRLPAEIDIANSAEIWATLTTASAATTGDVVIDASCLTFIDVSGVRAIVQVAAANPPHQLLRITEAPPCLLRTLTLCQWIDHPKLLLLPQSRPQRRSKPRP